VLVAAPVAHILLTVSNLGSGAIHVPVDYASNFG